VQEVTTATNAAAATGFTLTNEEKFSPTDRPNIAQCPTSSSNAQITGDNSKYQAALNDIDVSRTQVKWINENLVNSCDPAQTGFWAGKPDFCK